MTEQGGTSPVTGEASDADNRKQILFVDDESNFLAGIRRMLRPFRNQWKLHFAESVDQALSACEETDFDAIVSDVNMPEKTGFDLLKALKGSPVTRDIPVIILTGNAESDLKRRALDDGATDLLNKPVSIEDLTARVRNATQLKAYQDQLRNQNAILEVKVRERTLALEQSRMDIIWRLAKAGEFRDEDTGEHVVRVAACCRALAEAMNLEKGFTEALFATSPLHDIGKIGVPDGILLKSGRLSADERRIMERHCEIGAAILLEKPRGIEYFGATHEEAIHVMDADDSGWDLRKLAAEIAMTHHERWDGSGYPRGLQGDAIPIAGQITAVADVFDALRSTRSYKPAYDVDKTVELMEKGKGTHFSPDAFDAFRQIVDTFEEIRNGLADGSGPAMEED